MKLSEGIPWLHAISLRDVYNELIKLNILERDFAFGMLSENIARTDNANENMSFSSHYAGVILKYWNNITYNEIVSLTELAREQNSKNPSYIIQSWLRSRNTFEFLKIWEEKHNPFFDIDMSEEISKKTKLSSFTLTPKQWIAKTNAIGLTTKQGNGGGTHDHPDIALDFQMWMKPDLRVELIEFFRKFKNNDKKE